MGAGAYMSKKRRRLKAEALKREPHKEKLPDGAIPADQSKHAPHNSYDPPQYYVDEPFTCVDCGLKEVWTAEQQKWYYEVAKGPIYGRAVRCRECRRKRREQSERDRARNQSTNAENPYKSPEAEEPPVRRALAMPLLKGREWAALSTVVVCWFIYYGGRSTLVLVLVVGIMAWASKTWLERTPQS